MATSALWVPDRRDMIWIGFNPQAGQEMRDEHPMLVLSTKAFNERMPGEAAPVEAGVADRIR